jgi:hypothetical protein
MGSGRYWARASDVSDSLRHAGSRQYHLRNGGYARSPSSAYAESYDVSAVAVPPNRPA